MNNLLPLAIKKLHGSEHFNYALADLQRKVILLGRAQALNDVLGLGDSWSLADIKDYEPDAKRIYDEAGDAYTGSSFLMSSCYPRMQVLVSNNLRLWSLLALALLRFSKPKHLILNEALFVFSSEHFIVLRGL